METREWLVVESGGQKVFGMLHLPLGVERPPVVVFLHGFASNKYGHHRSYVKFAEALSQQGIASVRFDFRGSGDSEGCAATLSFEDLVADALAVIRYVHLSDKVDGERIGIFGSSLGGTIAIMAARSFPSLKALALWAPVASGEMWIREFMMQLGGSKDPLASLAQSRGVSLSPLFREQFSKMHAARVLATLAPLPFLHMQGAKDSMVLPLHQQVYKECCAQGAGHFITFPEAEHILGMSPVFPEVVSQSIQWFQRHLENSLCKKI